MNVLDELERLYKEYRDSRGTVQDIRAVGNRFRDACFDAFPSLLAAARRGATLSECAYRLGPLAQLYGEFDAALAPLLKEVGR